MLFEGKVVLITGAAGDIGKATAKQFANEGALLALVDIDYHLLEKTITELELDDGRYILIQADVTKEADVKAYVQRTKEKFGKIDVFFNNAGIGGHFSFIADYPVEALEAVLNVNIKGVFLGLKHVLKVMAEQKSGSIINTSSIGGKKGMPYTSAYNASKFAVIGLTKSAAIEYGSSGVRINAVCPAPVYGRMMDAVAKGVRPDDTEGFRDDFIQTIPLGRYAEPADIAKAVYFLASDNASFVSGAALEVDGAFTA